MTIADIPDKYEQKIKEPSGNTAQFISNDLFFTYSIPGEIYKGYILLINYKLFE